MTPELPRHAFVSVDASARWGALGDSSAERVRAWLQADRPAIVARLQGDEPPDFLRLGIALPGKHRLTFAAPQCAIERVRSAPTLRNIVESCPVTWRDDIRGLLGIASTVSLEPRVYGSFAWEAMTGDRYVGPDSDIDLAWHPRSVRDLAALTAALLDWERSTGRRADGEVLLPNGDAVCWRELASESSCVLVKTRSSVALRARSDCMAALA